MIFAPRSCPSRPGLATTTRIFWVVLGADIGTERRDSMPAETTTGPRRDPRARRCAARRRYETRSGIFIVGCCTSPTIVYVPARVNRLEAVPRVLTREIVPRCGPFEIRTLCGRPPVHRNVTVSPRLMLSREVPNLMPGPVRTDFVAANAGTAT